MKIYVRERKGSIEYTTSGKIRYSYTTNGHGIYAKKLAQLSLKYNRKFNNYYKEKDNHTNIYIYNKTFGYFRVKISKEDFEDVQRYKWNVIKDHNTFYVTNKNAGLLHRYLLKPDDELVVDHINGDGTDNRRENLRVVPRYVNMRNMHKNNTIGIYKYKKYYVATINSKKNKMISKSFNIEKLGDDEAFNLAKSWRQEQERKYGYYNNLTRQLFK